jgi:acetolactate synthase I/II/III large subunit
MAMTTGSKYLAQALHEYGVTHAFLVPFVLPRSLAAMDQLGIKPVSAHSELAAVYMADGYGRASRRAGIAMSQTVGAANIAAGLRDPWLGCSPVIAITGGPSAATRYRYLYQEVEDFPMFEPVTKWNARVETCEQLPGLLATAFRTATSGTPGPVHLEVAGRAGDVLDREADLTPNVDARFGAYPPFRSSPDAASVAAAVRAIGAARTPVLVIGGGVIASGAEDLAVQLAERHSLPIITTLNAKSAAPDCHPLNMGISGTYGRWSTNRLLTEADLVVWLGTRAGGMVTEIWKAPKAGTPGVYFDLDPTVVGRDFPVAAAVVGDARESLLAALAVDAPAVDRTAWVGRAQSLLKAWRDSVSEPRASDGSPIRPERICRDLANVLPADGIVVSDTGHSAQWTGTMLWLRQSTQRYIRCAGTLGWGLPGAIGVKCALPNRPVVCFTGDGGLYYHISELETASRLGINVVLIVNNNSGFSQTRRSFAAAYAGVGGGDGSNVWKFGSTDFAAVARAMGCVGERIERAGDLAPALERAMTCGRPALLDVITPVDALPQSPWGGPA